MINLFSTLTRSCLHALRVTLAPISPAAGLPGRTVKDSARLSPLVFALLGILSTGCNTANQPNYAQSFQAKNLQAEIEYREVEFSPLDRLDGGLSVEMLSVEDDGALLLRTEFGIDELRAGQRKLLNGHFIELLEADPVAQVARLKTWPKSVFQ